MTLSRRDLLRRIGWGGAAVLGGTALGRAASAAGGGESYPGAIGHSALHDSGDLYGHVVDPPAGLAADALDPLTFPPPEAAGDVEVELDVVERTIEVGAGAFAEAWTYSGSVPGPILRVREGATLKARVRNLTAEPHSLHFHGRHRPEMDGWEPIPAGGAAVYEIEAGPAGFHPYHCHTAPLAEHIARGLFGGMIVDPPGGRPPAREVVLILNGWTPVGMERNAVVAWNGVAGFYGRHPIKVEAGEPVRVYLANMVEYEPLASFHLHAQTFGVWPAGMGEVPAYHGDVVTLGMAERAVLEFDLPAVGRYMFHPHQHHLAERGAMGWFAAV